jgi:DNA (cytosine-5)-methyltransferase 1
MKILNLYAGIGGNRKLWGDEHDITAVEIDPEVAKVYQDYFPNDKIVIGDAHQFLLDHFQDFDFIWSSPPCPSHSRINSWTVPTGQRQLEYPDMKLWQEIILLQNWYKDGKWVVENVIPYYPPLIPGRQVDRHLFWANFNIGSFEPRKKKRPHKGSDAKYLAEFYGYKVNGTGIKDKRKALRNCVHPETGLYILNCAMNIITKQNVTQETLF